MRLLKNKRFLVLCLVLLLANKCFADLITTAPGGTFTSGYRPTEYSITGTLRGHVMFKNGLYINSTNVTWDSDGVLSGGLRWASNANILILSSDLKLGSTASITYNAWSNKIRGKGSKIELGSNLNLSGLLTVDGSSLTIDGRGNTLAITNVGTAINVQDSATLTLKNMTLYIDIYGSTPVGGTFSVASTSNLILDNVRVICKPTGVFAPHALFSGGTLTIRGNVSFESEGKVTSDQFLPAGVIQLAALNALSVMIEKNSTLKICKNTSFALTGAASASCSIAMSDQTSVLHLDGCDFYSSSSGLALAGLLLTKGTVLFENQIRIFNGYYEKINYGPNTSRNADMTKGIIFGDGTPVNDVNVRMLSSAYVTVDGCMRYYHS